MQRFRFYFANALIFDKKKFFSVLFFFFCRILCLCASLTTSVHNMMLEPNASGIYDSTFEFNRIYLKQ